MLDKNDTLKFYESDLNNFLGTIIEIIIILGICGYIAYNRKFDYSEELIHINDEFNKEIETLKQMQEELALTKKILKMKQENLLMLNNNSENINKDDEYSYTLRK